MMALNFFENRSIEQSSGTGATEDYNLLLNLLNKPRYKIPERLRDKVMNNLEATLDDDEEDVKTKLKAVQLIATLDKHNIDIAKAVMPKKQEIDVRKTETAELLRLVRDTIRVLPPEEKKLLLSDTQ